MQSRSRFSLTVSLCEFRSLSLSIFLSSFLTQFRWPKSLRHFSVFPLRPLPLRLALDCTLTALAPFCSVVQHELQSIKRKTNQSHLDTFCCAAFKCPPNIRLLYSRYVLFDPDSLSLSLSSSESLCSSSYLLPFGAPQFHPESHLIQFGPQSFTFDLQAHSQKPC
jgi:hypothetical protein